MHDPTFESIRNVAPDKQLVIAGFGASTMRGWRPGLEPQQTFRALLQKGLREKDIPAVVTNSAVPGNTSLMAMARFERDVLNINPDVVLIDIGIADAWLTDVYTKPRVPIETYRNILQCWIEALQARHIEIVFITLQPMAPPTYGPERNTVIQQYVAVQREVAERAGIPVVDVFARLTQMQQAGFELNQLYLDGQHFNAEGNKLVGDMLLELEQQTEYFSRAWAAKAHKGVDPQTASEGSAPMPYNRQVFDHIGVTDIWERYDGVLSWGKGQTLAVLGDGCDLFVPQWKTQLPWGPKVIASFDAITGATGSLAGGAHGTTAAYPSSLHYDGVLGVAYNNQVAHVRAVTGAHLRRDETPSLATALQWVIDNREKYNITAVNLSMMDDVRHASPVASPLDAKLKILREHNVWVSAPTGDNNFAEGISWPACAEYCFAIGAAFPGRHEIHRDRGTSTDLLVAGTYTASSNTYAAACAMILREAIEITQYSWRYDGSTLPDAMMKIFRDTGVDVYDNATGVTYRELNLPSAINFIFEKTR